MNRFLSRRTLFILITCLLFSMCVGGCSSKNKKPEKNYIKIGLALYRDDDPFINNVRLQLEQRAKEFELETGNKVVIDVQSAKGSQELQNRQVDRFISLECDVLCINPVDRMAVSSMISNAMDAGIPIIFFNRQPTDEDMKRWEKLYYVGVDAKETAQLQGQIILDLYHDDPLSFDKNGDGVVSYVLLEGESSHQDSLIRTEVSIQTLMDADMPIQRLTGGIANWERSQASVMMENWLKEYPDEIELVISNNDAMALGALDAMDRADIHDINVVGIDAISEAVEAVRAGRMIGTVENDLVLYSQAIFNLAAREAMPGLETTPVELEDGKYFWCRQHILAK